MAENVFPSNFNSLLIDNNSKKINKITMNSFLWGNEYTGSESLFPSNRVLIKRNELFIKMNKVK